MTDDTADDDTAPDEGGTPPAGAPDAAEPGPAATPGRRRRWVAGLAAVAVVAAVGVAVAVREPPAEPDGTVILYGDSLSVEARDVFAARVRATTAADVVLRPVAGLSPCDARPGMDDDVALQPDVVVIQFVGNNESPCSRGPDGEHLTGQALADRYESDVREIVEMWAAAGTRVVLVGGPTAPGLPGEASDQIADAYNRIVNEWAGRDLGRVRYADAAATVTGPDHDFVTQLPCRDSEDAAAGCAEGEVTVRSPDRIHFCPTELAEDTILCLGPSPGAVRFGEEMARVAGMALDPGY
jgi:hypothetical protein